uniref:Uncharacterized protein n=1 Tax=Anguilla anguilla TaxID=7936 RepID=A0A0E9WAD6_ANGAN
MQTPENAFASAKHIVMSAEIRFGEQF